MSFKPFYISTFEQDSGENTYFNSFLIPEKAFQKLEDAMCWRGKILKRPGITHLGRLRRILTTKTLSVQFPALPAIDTNIADFFSDPAIDLRNPATGNKEPYAEIEPGSVTITVGAETFVDTGLNGTLTGTTGSGNINYVTGAIYLQIPAGLLMATNIVVTLAYFPTLPVMGLQRREESSVNDEQPIAFDTKYAYTISGLKFIELLSTTPTTWQGDNWQLFWIANYYTQPAPSGRLYWATNNNKGAFPDPIRYYNGATWTNFAPVLDAAGNKLQQCRILIGYKNRLIAMNTWEGPAPAGSINYQNRIRWSQNGDPTVIIDPTSWREDIVGKGSYLTAPTNEAIMSAAFIRDTLVVKFERSSWKLLYTGNENLPFVFQKVNTDFGCESPFSIITFDKGVLAIGDKGITVDDSVNVARIDRTVPDVVFSIRNDDSGNERVYGIRDYESECVYWAYPEGTTAGPTPKFPNKVLVYNYVNETWCKFNDSFTCYGYFQKLQSKTWANYTSTTSDIWKAIGHSWISGVAEALYPDTIAGNQQGFVSIVSSAKDPETNNGKTLTIRAITGAAYPVEITVPYHNLLTGQFIKIKGIIGTVGATGLNPNTLNNVTTGTNRIFRVIRLTEHTLALQEYDTVSGLFVSVDLGKALYTGVYWGGGQVYVLNSFDIITKQFSPFYEQGSQCRLGYVDLFTDITVDGEYSADVYVDSSFGVSITRDTGGSTMGSNIVSTAPNATGLIPFQALQTKIWNRLFTQTIAQNFTLELSLSDEQMADPAKDASSYDFGLHALAFYLSPNARLVQ